MFAAVAESGSYAAAAEATHKSVSSVHAAVAKLQGALGVRLLQVDGRRAVPTEAGRQLLGRGRGLLDDARGLERLATTLAAGVEPRVRLAYDAVFPREALLDALEALTGRFPQLRVELHETVIRGAAELLERGEVEIAITPTVPRVGTAETLGRVRFVPVASPAHPLHALGRPLALADLRRARRIVVRDATPAAPDGGPADAARERWTVDSMALSIELIERGLGYAWLPLSRVGAALAEGRLAPLPMRRPVAREVELLLAHLDDETAGPVCRFLLDALRARGAVGEDRD